MTFPGDGVTIPGTLYRPVAAPGPRPAVLSLHGGAGIGASDHEHARMLASQDGYVVLVADRRAARMTLFDQGPQTIDGGSSALVFARDMARAWLHDGAAGRSLAAEAWVLPGTGGRITLPLLAVPPAASGYEVAVETPAGANVWRGPGSLLLGSAPFAEPAAPGAPPVLLTEPAAPADPLRFAVSR